MILALRTDQPEAEVVLLSPTGEVSVREKWHAHRELAETIHAKLQTMLKSQSIDYSDIDTVIVYKGPGSFTGLRIGISVANAITYSQDIKIVGVTGEDWLSEGVKKLASAKRRAPVTPEYGAPVHITTPKK